MIIVAALSLSLRDNDREQREIEPDNLKKCLQVYFIASGQETMFKEITVYLEYADKSFAGLG